MEQGAVQEQQPKMRTLSDEDLAFLILYRTTRQQQAVDAGATPRREDEDKAGEELRKHVHQLWQTCLAKTARVYLCVRELLFLHTRVDRHFHYPEVLATIKSDPHARYLDLGCCFGTDTRRVLVDGWKEDNVVAVDVVPDFWNYGLQLFDDAEVLRAKALFGDVTEDQAFVRSLVEDGQFAHAWTGLVLHVLTEAKIEALVRSVLVMLKPGGTYFGTCVGSPSHPTEWQPDGANRSPGFLHTAASLKALLEAVGYVEVVVKEFETTALHTTPPEEGGSSNKWSHLPKIILIYKAQKP